MNGQALCFPNNSDPAIQIQRVEIGSILDVTTIPGDNHDVLVLEPLSFVNFSLEAEMLVPTQEIHWSIWIDFNGDGILNNLTENVYQSGPVTSFITTGSFDIPHDTTITFLDSSRIYVGIGRTAVSDPCLADGFLSYKTAKDHYNVEIIDDGSLGRYSIECIPIINGNSARLDVITKVRVWDNIVNEAPSQLTNTTIELSCTFTRQAGSSLLQFQTGQSKLLLSSNPTFNYLGVIDDKDVYEYEYGGTIFLGPIGTKITEGWYDFKFSANRTTYKYETSKDDNTIIRPVYIGCSKCQSASLEIKDQPTLDNLPNPFNIVEGKITLGGPTTVEIKDKALTGNSYTFQSGEEVEIKGEFVANEGAEVYAHILECIPSKPKPKRLAAQEDKLVCYPNPTQSKSKVSYTPLEHISHLNIELLNIHGKRIYQQTKSYQMTQDKVEIELDLSHLPSGNYLCRLTSAYDSQVVKILKINP